MVFVKTLVLLVFFVFQVVVPVPTVDEPKAPGAFEN